jgi:hypothetical protein
VDGESFGFDTVRLKENNTAFAFDDTSLSAGFPANDWSLQAHDTNNGGRNVFKLYDVTNNKTPFAVMANAPTNSLFVDASGNVTTGGALQQSTDTENATPVDAANVLAKLRALPITQAELTSDPVNALHLAPAGTDFRAAFGLGASGGAIAPVDLASVSLAGLQALAQRVDDLDTSATGALNDRIDQLTTAGEASDKRIAALVTSNRKLGTASRRLSRHMAALKKQVKALAAAQR